MIPVLIDRFANGVGNMAAEFAYNDVMRVRFALVQLQVHFRRIGGSPTLWTAPVVISRVSLKGADYENQLWRITEAGMKADDSPTDVNLRIGEEDERFYRFSAIDAVRVSWVDPSAGSISWGVLASLRAY